MTVIRVTVRIGSQPAAVAAPTVATTAPAPKSDIRALVEELARTFGEMVRLTLPSGVSFVGYPTMPDATDLVILLGTDGRERHRVRLSAVTAASRVFHNRTATPTADPATGDPSGH